MMGLPPSRFAISPDARHLAFTAGPAPLTLWVRSLGTGAVRQLPGTEGVAVAFWSPDSRFMAFIADGKLKKISMSGGPAIALAEAQQGGGGGAWSPGDVIVFSSPAHTGLSRIDAGGGPVTPATTLDTAAGDDRHWWPYFLPDGRHFLYEAVGSSTSVDDPRAVYVGSLDAVDSSRLVLNGGSNAKYAEGHVLFMRSGTLMAQPFDVDRMELTGEETPVAERVVVGGNTGQSGAFSVSNAGVLVYQLTNGSELGHQLAWFDRTGKQVGVVSERAEYFGLELSPDGTRATVSIPNGGTTRRDIWIVDLLRGVRTAFTRHERSENAAVWWPDGSRIVFNGGRAPSGMDLYVKAASGAGSEELLLQDSLNKGPLSVSREGRFLIYGTPPPDSNLWVLPLTGDRKPIPYMQTPFNEAGGRFSPDGRWVAFGSNESGRPEIWVAPFPATGAKVLVSTAGAQFFSARWRDDGRELFYLSPEGTLMAAAVDGQRADFRVPSAKALFRLPVTPTTAAGTVYDVSADGQRFLVNMRPDDGGAMPLTIVFNWTAPLTRSSPRD
jgi:Tol biopolymer transport system component